MNKWYISALGLFFLSWSFMIFTLGGFIVYNNIDKFSDQALNEYNNSKIIENISNCQNLTLEKTSNCLRNYISTFYIYNKTDDALIQGLQGLKMRGGDCLDWSRLYKSMAEELGFYGKIHKINVENGKDHAFATIGDSTGYCRLDQLSPPDCFEYKK